VHGKDHNDRPETQSRRVLTTITRHGLQDFAFESINMVKVSAQKVVQGEHGNPDRLCQKLVDVAKEYGAKAVWKKQ
jgi:hypothetical protein